MSTTRLLLIRHAAHDRLGNVLCGRMAGVDLSGTGRLQADRVAATLPRLDAVASSPLARARQTAEQIARIAECALTVEPALDEIDMGAWTGAAFDTLAGDPRWAAWNTDRLHHRPPGGESMLEVQTRMAAWLARISTAERDRTIAAVSHADVIKAACCHALGLSIDHHDRFEIDPASVTTLVVGAWGMKLVRLNQPVP